MTLRGLNGKDDKTGRENLSSAFGFFVITFRVGKFCMFVIEVINEYSVWIFIFSAMLHLVAIIINIGELRNIHGNQIQVIAALWQRGGWVGYSVFITYLLFLVSIVVLVLSAK